MCLRGIIILGWNKKLITKMLVATIMMGSIINVSEIAHAESTHMNQEPQKFWINPWDRNEGKIPVTVTENALSQSTPSIFGSVGASMDFTPVWGQYTRVKNLNTVHHYQSVNNINTPANGFRTKWYLPSGFNVASGEHGNYQGMVIAKNSIYILESLGTGTNQGAIIRLKMDAIDAAKLNDLNHKDLLVKVFKFFDPFSKHGIDNSLAFDKYNAANEDNKEKIKKNQQIVTKKQKLLKHEQLNLAKKQKAIKQLETAIKKAKNKKQKTALNKKHQQLKTKLNAVKKTTNQKVQRLTKEINQANQKIKEVQAKMTNTANGKHSDLFSAFSQIAHSVSVSPLLNIGHGQTLSYNPKNQHLYLAQDDQLGTVSDNFYNQVTEVDSETLQPIHQYRFKMINKFNKAVALHTLAFDNQGHAYFGVHTGPMGAKGSYTMYYGDITSRGISFKINQNVIKWPGSFNQYVAHNPLNDRLYLVSNDVIISVPAKKVYSNTLKDSDVHYLTFNTHREFESLAFDNSGYGYLLTLWRSELLKSDKIMN